MYTSGSGRRTASWCWCARGCRRHSRRRPCWDHRPGCHRGRAELVARVSTMNCSAGSVSSSPVPATPSGRRDQRVVRLQRDDHDAVAALGHQIEAVIEELAEQREPRVEAGRQSLVGRRVRDGQRDAGRYGSPGGPVGVQVVQDLAADGADQDAEAAVDEGLHGGRIGDRLIDDQVGDRARLRNRPPRRRSARRTCRTYRRSGRTDPAGAGKSGRLRRRTAGRARDCCTSRRRCEDRAWRTRLGSKSVRLAPAACCSAIMICWRMNSRSDLMRLAMTIST